MNTTATVIGLNVHPLKSGGGTAVASAELTPRGLRHDREFMLIRPDGRHLSQRENPLMALLRVCYDGVELTVETVPPCPEVVPLSLKAVREGPVHDVTVHGRPCRGVDQGEEAAGWFSAVLGQECRLVRFPEGDVRLSPIGDGEVAYADRFPLLVISVESLADLNSRLAGPLPMNRFRPSVVVEGWNEPYAEDGVRRMRIGSVTVDLVEACRRCVLTTVDQDSGVKGREPLRTLATYRTFDQEIFFGRHGVHRDTGTLRVGDPVTVVSRA